MPVMAALAPIFHAEATRNTDALLIFARSAANVQKHLSSRRYLDVLSDKASVPAARPLASSALNVLSI